MNKEILFRAKAINRDPNREYRTNYKNGDWVYGLITRFSIETSFGVSPAHMTNEEGIAGIDVDDNTIGQYIGRKDKNGTKIFEGDIFEIEDDGYFVVQWGDGYFELQYYGYYEYCVDGNAYETRWGKLDAEPIWDWDIEGMEIKGNIFDTPELLKNIYEGE